MLSGKVPYYYIPIEIQVIYEKLIRGRQPRRPTESWITDDDWTLITRCWSDEPQHRPSLMEISEYVGSDHLGECPETQISVNSYLMRAQLTFTNPCVLKRWMLPRGLHKYPIPDSVLRNRTMEITIDSTLYGPNELRFTIQRLDNSRFI